MSSAFDASVSDAPPVPVTGFERVRVIVLLMAFCGLCHFNRVGMSVVGNEYLIQQYKFDRVEVGWIFTAYLIVYTALMTPGGWLIDRIGPRRALAGMELGSAVFVMLSALPSLLLGQPMLLMWSFFVIRGCLGAFTVPMHPGAARAVSLWLPPEGHSFGNSLITGTALLGIAASYPVFGWMCGKYDWWWAFVIMGCMTFFVAQLWIFTTRAHPAERPEKQEVMDSPPRPGLLRTLYKHHSLLLVTLSYAASGYFQYLFFYWLQLYFEEALQITTEASRFYAMIPMLAMAGGMVIGGALSDRISLSLGNRTGLAAVVVGGMIGSAIFAMGGMMLGKHTPGTGTAAAVATAEPEASPGKTGSTSDPAPAGPSDPSTERPLPAAGSDQSKETKPAASRTPRISPVPVVLLFSLAMACMGMAEGPFWTAATQMGGPQGGLAAAIFNTGGNLGGVVAPVLSAWLSKHFGWDVAIGVACLLCLGGAIVWIWIDPRPLPELEGSTPPDEPVR